MGKYKKYFWKVQGTFSFRRVWITGFLGKPKTNLGGLSDRFLQTGVKDCFLWKNGFLGNYKNFLDEPGDCAWWSVLSHSREKFFRLKNCFLLKQNKFLGRIFFFLVEEGWGEEGVWAWWVSQTNPFSTTGDCGGETRSGFGGKKLCLILSDFYFNSFMTEVPII